MIAPKLFPRNYTSFVMSRSPSMSAHKAANHSPKQLHLNAKVKLECCMNLISGTDGEWHNLPEGEAEER